MERRRRFEDHQLERSLSPDDDRRKYPVHEYRSKPRDFDYERYRASPPNERPRYREPYRFRSKEEAYAYEQSLKRKESRDLKYAPKYDDFERYHHRYSPETDPVNGYDRRISLHAYEKVGLRKYRSSID